MNLPQIRLESTFAKIGLQTEKPIQKIEQPRATLTIEQPPADLHIETTPGKLTIDQTQARADVDLKSVFRRTEDAAQQGYQDWLAGLARISAQGDQLMMIENGGNPIADQAKENGESPIYEFNIGWIPSHGSVKINYQPANVNIDWKLNKPKIEATINKPIHEYTPGKASAYLAERNSLTIDFVGINVDQKY